MALPLTRPPSAIARFEDDENLDWSLIAEEWPTFLYDERAGWNARDVRKGLFRGHVLARVRLPLCSPPPHIDDGSMTPPC